MIVVSVNDYGVYILPQIGANKQSDNLYPVSGDRVALGDYSPRAPTRSVRAVITASCKVLYEGVVMTIGHLLSLHELLGEGA